MVTTLLLLQACGGAALEKLAEQPAAAGTLVAVFPADGARNMGGAIPMSVVLGADAVGQVPEAGWRKAEDEEAGTLACRLDDSQVLVRCGELPELQPAVEGIETWTRLEAARREARLEPGTPAAAWAWELGAGDRSFQLGGDDAAGELLEEALGDLNLVGVIAGWIGEPLQGDLVLGPVEHGLDEGVRRPLAPGFTMVLSAEIDAEGRLTAFRDAAWLPLGSGQDAPHLLLLDVRLTASTADRGLEALHLEARLPAASLLLLGDELELSANTLASMVSLDVDWDEDGEPDSASLSLETQASPVSLSTW